MKLIDSHCHLDLDPLAKDIEGAVERAVKAGVTEMINIGSSMRGSERSVEIADDYPNIRAVVGLHPHEAGGILDLEGTMKKIEELGKNEQVVAIGEIGLDYFDATKQSLVNNDKRNEQKELFESQLTIAKRLKLPVVIHVRDAWDDFFKIMEDGGYKGQKGVIHCFTGDEKIAKKTLDLGFYLGFTGFVTFEQGKFDHIRKAVEQAPLGKILVETDAPFLAPEPYRGKPNEPAYVLEVAKKVAEIKQVPLEEVAQKTFTNTHKLFNLTTNA